jgi:hypothetical protein
MHGFHHVLGPQPITHELPRQNGQEDFYRQMPRTLSHTVTLHRLGMATTATLADKQFHLESCRPTF